ncbi:hypothetical protein GE09DRAFT_8699 [Coniochaeta sp. 2T2.1]|nr:hypothetical protein GE09DRAFT_8699 [Coniochaeta sp. 2T2.1]
MIPGNIKHGLREQEHQMVPAIVGSILLPIGSVFAGSSVWRSGVAGGAVVFARPLFINLGIHKGVTPLGVGGVLGILAIYVYGKKLRARYKFAQT